MKKIVTSSTTSPVTVNELKQHLLLWGDDSYDSELDSILLAASDYVAGWLNRPVGATVYSQGFKDFNIQLDHDGTGIVVKYFDDNATEQTLASSNYIVDSTGDRTRIVVKNEPIIGNDYSFPVQVQYSTGATTVSARVKHAILIASATLFENRAENSETQKYNCAMTVARLLGPERGVFV
ncbi:head-tail connector protein [Neptunicoccus sediminis]|uniref:head-tail connector protein n=1 Tax=Neptunicoccus sediminis TaxID=1892596 RepID=UPI0012FF6DBA|nr:head-tail connector protein [Neptunicoccus sediminis]